METTRAG